MMFKQLPGKWATGNLDGILGDSLYWLWWETPKLSFSFTSSEFGIWEVEYLADIL